MQHEAPTRADTRLELDTRECFEAVKNSPADAVLFLDPPYFTDNSSREYACGVNWGFEKHKELSDELKDRQRWILCHADHPQIRELYTGLQIVEYQDGKVWAGSSKGRRVELLVLSPWVSQRL